MKLGPFLCFLFMFLIIAFMFSDIEEAIRTASFTESIGLVVGYMPHVLIVVSVACMAYFALEGRDK